MKCKECQGILSTTNTRHRNDGSTLRYLKCDKCSSTFKSLEYLSEDMLAKMTTVLKRMLGNFNKSIHQSISEINEDGL